MAIHNLTLTLSPLIKVQNGATLASVSVGVHEDSQASLSGAVGSLDFENKPWKRYSVTGDLSGSFTFPPINVPSLTVDGLLWTFGIEFMQDATGGRTIDPDTLFANATREGVAAPNLEPSGATVVLLTARRQSSATTYTVNMAPIDRRRSSDARRAPDNR